MQEKDWGTVAAWVLLGAVLVLSDLVAGIVRGYGANPWGLF